MFRACGRNGLAGEFGCERHDVIGREPYADEFADMVIVVARHQRQHAAAARQFERVKKVRAAEHALDDARTQWRIVVVHDIVGSQQRIHHADVDASERRRATAQRPEFGLQDSPRVPLGRQETRLADELSREARCGPAKP